MSLRSFITNLFSSSVQAVSDAGVKTVTGSIKDVSGTAKDVTGIRKDLADTKLTEYKIEEHESQIQKATLEDVKRFDPKTRTVWRRARDEAYRYETWNKSTASSGWLVLLLVALCIALFRRDWLDRLLDWLRQLIAHI